MSTPRLKLADPSLVNTYMDAFPGVFFKQNLDFSFSYISPNFSQIFPGEILDDFQYNFIKCLHDEDRLLFIQKLNTNPSDTIQLHYRLQCPKEEELTYVFDLRNTIYDENKKIIGYEGILFNHSRQAIAEQHLAQASWREHLALLTSGLIHDFSNVITGIYSLSELYHSSVEASSPMYVGLSQIKKSALEAQKLIRRIIDLNRISTGNRAYHNLENLIQEQLDLFKILLQREVSIKTIFTGKTLPVYLDEVGFRQTLLNFAINAKDAIKDRGQITIQTRFVKAQDVLFKDTYHGAFIAPKNGVEIRFKDNGQGIEPQYIGQLFKPFFSTKDAHKGSGFGLYNAKLFVDKSEGYLSVKSKLQKGTTFCMYLPLANLETPTISKKIHTVNSKRYRAIVYSATDGLAFDLVNKLIESEWEVITFGCISSLITHIQNMQPKTDLFLALDIGNDVHTAILLEYFLMYHPEVYRTVQIIGSNPQSRSIQLKGLADCILDNSTNTQEAYTLIQNTILNPTIA